MNKKNNTIKLNKYFLIAIVLLLCAIIGKMGFVALAQKVDGIDLKSFASNRNITTQTIYADRGNIFDQSGEVLAQTVNSYTVIAFLSESRTTDETNPQHVVDKDMTAEKLSKILPNMSKETILDLLNRDAYQVELGPGGRGITELVKGQIESLDLPGISFISSTKRWYKMGSFAPYIIGYAKKNDNGEIVGEMGIESFYNETLKGTDGSKTYEKDAYGYQIPNTPSKIEEPESGSDIYLTLDNEIQLILENAVNEISSNVDLSWITLNVMDAKTGAIVGSASNPTFNLNTLDGIESYLNPLTSYTYEPGSTMKIFSFMAAMENGIYKGKDTYKSGTIEVADALIKDFNNKGWGVIDYDTGFAYSSNVAATKLALAMGADYLTDFYKKLGFGAKTGIELPGELAGKINFKYQVELANASFGQGVTTTPIQTLQALSVLANDGVMIKPYIVDRIVTKDGSVTYQAKREELGKKVSTETINYMKQLMHNVVYDGLADTKNYQPKNVTLIGKTGTAQIASKGGYLSGKYDYIRSFAGLFPEDNPRYIIYVSVKQMQGALKNIQDLVSDVVEEIAKTKYLTTNTNDIDTSKIITLDNYQGEETAQVEERLKKLELNPIKIGTGKYITSQYPSKDLTVMANGKVFLITNDKNYIMPEVKDWSTNEIITLCNLFGITYELNGYGYVKEVNIPPNTEIKPDSHLIITLERKTG